MLIIDDLQRVGGGLSFVNSKQGGASEGQRDVDGMMVHGCTVDCVVLLTLLHAHPPAKRLC